ncbi:hypothetical protein [Paraburkholderia metrosideri]|jgi:hypothetical protein|uniref:Uncharacterized protein n=1 Tax=Paraburkholderia metrosideri TaxID=580937 RepID=A0ABM8N916_9BURK|nr:hypothetical protein [Paraburkholderia metrosideri]CAD6509110.1 hypothetical protein LMG28140_00215 [Paraburkholderia metrosideri]
MDRRTFMMTGAWLSTVTGTAWPWFARAAAHEGTLAIVDSTLACGPSFARYAARMKLPTFETGDDIGALWYTTLAPLIGRTGGTSARRSVIGLIRASDYFVLDGFVTRSAHRVEQCHEPLGGSSVKHTHVAFAFTFVPRVAA